MSEKGKIKGGGGVVWGARRGRGHGVRRRRILWKKEHLIFDGINGPSCWVKSKVSRSFSSLTYTLLNPVGHFHYV